MLHLKFSKFILTLNRLGSPSKTVKYRILTIISVFNLKLIKNLKYDGIWL